MQQHGDGKKGKHGWLHTLFSVNKGKEQRK